MAQFKFYLEKDDNELILHYDNETSELRYENEDIVVAQNVFKDWAPFYKMDAGKRELTKIKIQLGLKCNYSCEYCSQRFIPRNPDDTYIHEVPVGHEEDGKIAQEIKKFVERFDKISIGKELTFELWGGEPFLYFEKMQLVTEQLHKKYPEAKFSVITNGSLLNQEIINFIQQYKFSVSISHDGVGQKTRGPDPLEDSDKKKWLFKLRNLLVPENRFSVNAMIHKDNDSRTEVQRWIRNNFGVVPIGEGGTVDAYDEGGASMSWNTPEEHIAYRRKAFREVMDRKIDQFSILHQKLENFITSLKEQRPSSSLGQKCSMDRPDNMAVDLNGNVITCQNVTISSNNPDDISHHIGHMDDLEAIIIKTGTHWSDREECPKCPVLHLCQGSCLFLSPGSKEWKLSCDNSYSDNVVWLAAALYELTGHILYRIEGEGLPEYRQDVFGFETKAYAGIP